MIKTNTDKRKIPVTLSFTVGAENLPPEDIHESD